jgi:hypothetical protein
MRCINIPKFNRLGRMPMLMLAAGVLALALVAIGGATAKRADAAIGTYTLEVSFEFLRFADINDGFANNDAELFGTIDAWLDGSNNSPQLMIGTYNNPGVCGTSWTGSGQCYKTVNENVTNFFSQTPMCPADLGENCIAPYATGNNKMRFQVTVTPDNSQLSRSASISVNLRDYDKTSGNDRMCVINQGLSFYGSEVATLDKTIDYHGDRYLPQDGDCTVRVRFHRV